MKTVINNFIGLSSKFNSGWNVKQQLARLAGCSGGCQHARTTDYGAV